MNIENNKVVSFYFKLSDTNGNEIESNHGGEPVSYLYGQRNILLALESEMMGKKSGDVLTVTLKPEEAYGLPKEDAISRVSIKHLLTKGKLKAGQAVKIKTPNGQRDATIIKVGRFNVDVDNNHPLAGKSLIFDIEIADVRAATAEELSHGHSHGVGGHQH